MWSARPNRDEESVVCIACGDSLPRRRAREYDKEGDRWDRRGKEFEYLCKSCHRDLCHQPREDLEDVLLDVESEREGSRDAEAFMRTYIRAVRERYGAPESDAEDGTDSGDD
ncbi:DUF7562 family protein [Halorarum halobium]|uniref:DUF7562 family protein n=1 Tax=Halorarum halobium TaxID=3075121 RepID=UPI0028A78C87|nr:hypothetical protein [Halobaculum sp. XH14]